MKRYELPNLGGLNFVVEHALEGGVNASPAGPPRQEPELRAARPEVAASRLSPFPVSNNNNTGENDMITALGFGLMFLIVTLILLRRISPLVAFVTLPVIASALAGFGLGKSASSSPRG